MNEEGKAASYNVTNHGGEENNNQYGPTEAQMKANQAAERKSVPCSDVTYRAFGDMYAL